MQVHRRCAACSTRWPLAFAALAVFVAVLTGCGNDRGSGADDALSHADERVPTLPGAGQASAAVEPSKPVLAQRFGVNGNAVTPPASGGLLPPVMHSAD